MNRPRIGITPDLSDDRCTAARCYGQSVWDAGGLPIILPIVRDAERDLLRLCDGLILSGGDDPVMEGFGVETHPNAKRMHSDRQAFELELLRLADAHQDLPVLGICLGMQLMALHHGGTLDQHLPDTLATHAQHWGRVEHAIHGALGSGIVHSHHRQAIVDPGGLSVAAVAGDAVIEAVRDEQRRFYVGVQWHPERTADAALSARLFEQLVHAARTTSDAHW
jgi:putative glutamine amidotransferase